MPTHPTPPPPVQAVAARLTQPHPMRRGSLSERFVKCSKSGCGCATDPNARHGPYFSWTRVVDGKTQSRLLSREQAAVVKNQIEAGHQFRDEVEAYWQVCEVWADEEVEGQANQSAEAVKKGALRHPPRRDLPRNRTADRTGRRRGNRL